MLVSGIIAQYFQYDYKISQCWTASHEIALILLNPNVTLMKHWIHKGSADLLADRLLAT